MAEHAPKARCSPQALNTNLELNRSPLPARSIDQTSPKTTAPEPKPLGSTSFKAPSLRSQFLRGSSPANLRAELKRLRTTTDRIKAVSKEQIRLSAALGSKISPRGITILDRLIRFLEYLLIMLDERLAAKVRAFLLPRITRLVKTKREHEEELEKERETREQAAAKGRALEGPAPTRN